MRRVNGWVYVTIGVILIIFMVCYPSGLMVDIVLFAGGIVFACLGWYCIHKAKTDPYGRR